MEIDACSLTERAMIKPESIISCMLLTQMMSVLSALLHGIHSHLPPEASYVWTGMRSTL